MRVLPLILCLSAFAQELTIVADPAHPLKITADALAAMPRTSLTYSDHGTSVRYEGVLLYELAKRAGAPLDKELSGKAIASYLLIEAKDGYQAIVGLTEIDPAFTDDKILIADTVDGKPLGPNQGPFRLVVPQEKKAARSVRMVERITLVRLRK